MELAGPQIKDVSEIITSMTSAVIEIRKYHIGFKVHLHVGSGRLISL